MCHLTLGNPRYVTFLYPVTYTVIRISKWIPYFPQHFLCLSLFLPYLLRIYGRPYADYICKRTREWIFIPLFYHLKKGRRKKGERTGFKPSNVLGDISLKFTEKFGKSPQFWIIAKMLLQIVLPYVWWLKLCMYIYILYIRSW